MKAKHMLVYGGIVLCLSILYLIWRGGGAVDGFADKKGPEFIMYYADWCPHCQVIKDDNDFKKFLTTPMTVGGKKVNMRMVESATEEAKAAKVEGYPTFRLFKEDGSMEEYKGARTIKDIKSYIESELKN